MAIAQKAVARLLFVAVVHGFRVKPKQRQAINKDNALLQSGYVADHFRRVTQNSKASKEEQVITQDPDIDPSEDQGSNEVLRNAVAQELTEATPPVQLSPDSLPHCHLSESDCNIGDMSGATLVFTDSDNSRCFNGDPFAFLVKPGRSDELLFYFPSGGACWESTLWPDGVRLCRQSLEDGLTNTGLNGGFTDSREGNSFRDFTFVSPPYCDGGAMFANTTLGGASQYGYTNTLFALEWAKRNFNQTLANFVIAGSSAGALGIMGWSHHMLSTFQYKKATVIVDSYMAVFPDGTQGSTLKQFGVCDLPMWSHFREACEDEASNLQDMFDHAIESHPTVAFAVIQPKWDLVQRAFYAAIALSFIRLDLYISTADFYKQTNDMLWRYSRHHNFVHYYVDGGFHTFVYWHYYYSATVKGFTGFLGHGDKPTLANWTNALIEHQPVQSQCNGDLERNGGNNLVFKNTRYCDEALHPKTLSVIPSSQLAPLPSARQPSDRHCPWYCGLRLCIATVCKNSCDYC